MLDFLIVSGGIILWLAFIAWGAWHQSSRSEENRKATGLDVADDFQ